MSYCYILMLLLGNWRGTVDVAVKQLRSLDTSRSFGADKHERFLKAQEEFNKESNILRVLHHPHLVQVNI